jgi:hypothetical protein
LKERENESFLSLSLSMPFFIQLVAGRENGICFLLVFEKKVFLLVRKKTLFLSLSMPFFIQLVAGRENGICFLLVFEKKVFLLVRKKTLFLSLSVRALALRRRRRKWI